MELFTYLMAKNDHNTSVKKDLFSYLLGKGQSGTWTDYSGTNLSINNTKKGKMKLSLKGNTSQTGTPTPDNPIPVNVVSGDNEVVVSGINVWDEEWEQGTLNASTGALITINTRIRSKNFIPVFSNTNYYYTIPSIASNCLVVYYDGNNNYISSVYVYSGNYLKTTPANCKYIKISPDATYGATYNNDICINVSDVNINGTYYPYTGASYPIHLGTYELCKIGTYQDKFIRNSGKNLISSLDRLYNTIYFNGVSTATDHIFEAGTYTFSYQSSKTIYLYIQKDGEEGTSTSLGSNKTITFTSNVKFNIWLYASGLVEEDVIQPMLNEGETALPYEPYGNGEWYLEKKIGKVVLDGNTNFNSVDDLGSGTYRFVNNSLLDGINSISYTYGLEVGYSNYFHYLMQYSGSLSDQRVYTADKGLIIITSVASTSNELKTWLGTHNTTVYYVLSSPTYTKITDSTLHNQLEAVWRANSYSGQTNISQINNDLPFELNVSVKVGS